MRIAIIQAHHGVEETVARHLPLWEQTSDEQIFVCARGCALDSGVQQFEFGSAEHHGVGAALRILMICELALSNPHCEEIEFHEYDSFLLERLAPPAGGMAAILHPQNKPHKFLSKFYLHYPHVYSRAALVRLATELQKVFIENNRDRYWSDRFIGFAAERAGIEVDDLLRKGKGYSKNTILLEHREAAVLAAKRGAVAFHGVKDADTLKAITGAHA